MAEVPLKKKYTVSNGLKSFNAKPRVGTSRSGRVGKRKGRVRQRPMPQNWLG